jgi:hypothetical protein
MICAHDGCENEFEQKTHNMKYCSDECCRTATNLKIKQKYYEKKERLAGKQRVCKTRGCTTRLSRYNPSSICGVCEAKDREKLRASLIEMVNDVSS